MEVVILSKEEIKEIAKKFGAKIINEAIWTS